MATALQQLEELEGSDSLVAVETPTVTPPQGNALSQLQSLEQTVGTDEFAPPSDNSDVFGKPEHGIRSPAEAAQVVNKGAISPFLLPLDVIGFQRSILGDETADRLGAPPSFGDVAREGLHSIGFIPKPGDDPEGVLADSLEIFGGSLPFGFGLFKYGQSVAGKIPQNLRNRFQQSLVDVTQDTGKLSIKGAEIGVPKGLIRTTGLDLSSSVGAAIGGKVSEELEFGPLGTALTQMGFGFVHPLSVANVTLSGRNATRALDTILPGGTAKNTRRAARELQKGVPDPEIVGANIDIASTTPAARQVGAEGALQLEQRVLNTDPILRQQYTDDLNKAIDDAIADGRRFGDQKAAGRELEAQSKRAAGFSADQSKRHIRLLEIRSAQAMQESERAISRLGPDATIEDASRIVRTKLEEALKTSRTLEREAWEAIDGTVPVTPSATNAFVNEELRKMSKKFGDFSLIPADVKRLLKTQGVNVLDTQTVRSGVNEAHDAARTAGRKNEARILSGISDALMTDLKATKASGVENAIAVSRKLNQQFTQGAVGDVLAVGKGGVAKVTARETVQTITGRRGAAEGIEQMIKGDPSIEGDIRNFVKSSYYTSVLLDAGGKPQRIQQLHNQFVRRIKKQGVLETFPDIEGQLIATRNSVLKDANIKSQLKVANKRGGILLQSNRKKRIANETMGGNGDIVLDGLITSKNPLDDARNLVRTMDGNPAAKQGLKAAFMDSLYRKATNNAGDIDNKKLSALIKNNGETARALGFSVDELTRMNRIEEAITAANLKPQVSSSGRIVEDSTGFVLDVLARWTAVSAAGVVPTKGAGASLQMANLFSGRMKKILNAVGSDGAAELIKAAHTDNKLYQALLVSSTSSAARQNTAAKHIQAWLPSLASKHDNEIRENQ